MPQRERPSRYPPAPATRRPAVLERTALAATASLAASALALLAGTAPAGAAPRPALEEELRLASGVDLVWQVRRASPEVHGTVRVDLEPADEPADQVGLTRLLLEVLGAVGARSMPRPEIDAWLAERGASLELALEPRATSAGGALGGGALAIEFRCAPDDLAEALALARALLVEPAYAERPVESAKNRLLARLGRRSPGPLADRALAELLEGDATTRARLPHPADLEQLDAAAVEAWHRERASAARTRIALHGPLPEGLVGLVEGVFGDFPAGASEAAPTEGAPPGATPPAENEPSSGALAVDLPGAAHTEVRAGLAPNGTAEQPPETVAALALWAAAHTPPAHALARPESAAEIPASLDVTFEPALDLTGGRLTAAVGLPHALAAAAGPALAEALAPAPDAALDPERLEAARAAALAVFAPADDGLRLRSVQALARADVPVERTDAAVAAIESLDAAAVVRLVAEYAAGCALGTVYVGAAGELRPALAEVEGLSWRADVRQPRGPAAALALRAELLRAVGDGWAELETLAVEGTAALPQVPDPVPVSITRSLTGGEALIRQRVFDQQALTVTTPGRSWVVQSGAVTELDAGRHRALRHAEERQLFRLFRLLAAGREVLLSSEGRRLELWRGAERLAWLELADDGLPLAVGHDGARELVGEPSRSELSEWRHTAWPADDPGRAALAWPARMRQPEKGTEHRFERFEPGAALDPELLKPPGG